MSLSFQIDVNDLFSLAIIAACHVHLNPRTVLAEIFTPCSINFMTERFDDIDVRA